MKSFMFLAATATTLLLVGQAQAGRVTVYENNGPYCREFTSTITVGNRLEEGVGTACQQPDGSWQIVSGPGTGNSFIDNGIPVRYPANTYVNNVYYAQPSRVQYVFTERTYRPAPVIVTQVGPGYGYYDNWYRHHHHRPPRNWGRYGDDHGHHVGRH